MVLSLEYAVLARTGLFVRGGLLDWEVLATLRRWTSVGRFAGPLEAIFSPSAFGRLAQLRIALSLTIGLGALTGASLVTGLACLASFLIGIIWAVRHPYGRDGADEMHSLSLGGLSVAFLVPDRTVKLIAVGFLCAQLTLSYLVAGIAKCLSRSWMRQGVLASILNTDVYGRRFGVGRWLHAHPRLDVGLGQFVVLMEVGYPLVFLIPRPYAVGWLLVTLGFHLASAIFMGLNTFLYAFSGVIVLAYWIVTCY